MAAGNTRHNSYCVKYAQATSSENKNVLCRLLLLANVIITVQWTDRQKDRQSQNIQEILILQYLQ